MGKSWLKQRGLFIIFLTGVITKSLAGIIYGGDVSPDPNTWNHGDMVVVGNSNNGFLEVTDMSKIYSYHAIIGNFNTSTGTVTITDFGSKWSVLHLYVGYNGTGNLIISDEGLVNVDQKLTVSSRGSVHLKSGGILKTGEATLGSGAILSYALADHENTGKLVVSGNLYNNGALIKVSSSDPLQKYAEHEIIKAGNIINKFEQFDTNSILSVYEVSLKQTTTNVIATINGVKKQTTDAPSMAKASMALANVVMNNVSKHAGVSRSLLRSSDNFGDAPSGPAGPRIHLASGEWVGYMSQFNDLGGLDSKGATDGYDWQTSGYMLGMEKLVNEQLIFGFGIGQSWTDLDGKRGSGGGASELFISSLYGNWFNESAYCEFGFLYARSDNDTERIDTALDRYKGKYDSEMFGGWLEAGWMLKKSDTTELEPYVRTTYVSGNQDGYTDAGVGTAPMTVAANGTDNWLVEGGACLAREWNLESEKKVRVELKAGVQCELLDTSVTVNTEVAGAGQRAQGPDADRVALILGARADVGLTDSLNVGIGYQPTLSGNWQNHLIDFTLKYEF